MSNKLRKLRIAFSVCCGIVCLLLIVLWVRSHKYHDRWDVVYSSGTGMLRIVSREGVVLFAPWVFSNSGKNPQTGFSQHEILNVVLEANHDRAGKPLKKWRSWKYSKHNYPGGSIERDLFLPHWFLALVVGSLGALPWIKNARRFSLRTLLIATTLVAVALGLAVAMQ